MVRKGLEVLLAIAFAFASPVPVAGAAGPTPAVTIRLIRPDLQCRGVLDLFRGARLPHPAAALSAWKRAALPQEGRGLGRPLEAAIAVFNPEMVAELRGLDQAEVVLAFDPDRNGALLWHATLPRDDGAFANLATAQALTDGRVEPPIGAIAVDRLGPPGAPFSARGPHGLALADSRASLIDALDPARPGVGSDPRNASTPDSCWVVALDPEGLGHAGPIARRRLAEALRALGCRQVVAVTGLESDSLTTTLTSTIRSNAPTLPAATIDRAWLDGLPAPGANLLAAFAWAIDPSSASWDRAFAAADRIERADPARAGVAPLRMRLNLLAATVQVRPEVDLWPHLRGLSGALLVDPSGHLDGALLALHAASPEAAGRIAVAVLPRLAPLLGLHPEAPSDERLLGRFRDRPVFLSRRGTRVQLAWGESGRSAPAKPGAEVPPLRNLLPAGTQPPQRFAAFWPGRLSPSTVALGEPFVSSLREASPVLWMGRNDASGASDVVRWSGLGELVRRILDRLPLDPAPIAP